jgi:hypothetical protein
MKKIVYFSIGLSLFSCGGNDKKGGDVNLTTVLKEMVAKKQLSEEDKKKILENYKVAENQKAKDEESDENSGEIPEKINSLEIFTNIFKDRSLYMDKYVDREIVITDLLLRDVYVSDVDGDFKKCASAVPFDSKKFVVASVKGEKRYVTTNYNYETGESEDIYENTSGPEFSYKGKWLTKKPDLAQTDFPVIIEFKNADELKKIGLLDWENNEGTDFSHKISVKGKIEKESIEYKPGTGEDKNIKSYGIKIKIVNAVIYTK